MNRVLALATAVALAAVAVPRARATMSLGPWETLFKGIEHAKGTNTPGGGFPNEHVIHVLRVDLSDPDIRLFSSPRIDNYAAGSRETPGYTVSEFLKRHQLQVAINGGLFNPQEYYLPAGTPMDISGLGICEGVVVSPQEGPSDAAVVAFTQANVPTVIPTNWPPVSTAGIYTAVAGAYPILVNGVNVGYNYKPGSDFIHQTNPRTAFGVSQDKRWLFLLTIDGRQPGYSVGALDYEAGAWLLHFGAWDGVNMDGGGSTTMVIADSIGKPLRLNRSSAVADSGKERTVGSAFGIYAAPALGFINDLVAVPDETTATISWTTTAPATTRLDYGPTTELGLQTELQSEQVTEHSVAIAGLTQGIPYYFRAISHDGSEEHASSMRYFVTSNYVTTATLFGMEKVWKFTTANLDGVPWTSRDYSDSQWPGSGAGLFWVDARGKPQPGIEPAVTELPTDPANPGYPYQTYYFRTHFTLDGDLTRISLICTNWADDGAVYYLNGKEVQRIRMEELPAPITYSSVATSYPCAGDANCADEFMLSGSLTTNLVAGDNVLAVEVHNLDSRSRDITFGMTVDFTRPIENQVRPTLSISASEGTVRLDWTGGGFVLQEALSPDGPWNDVPGPVVEGPYQSPDSEGVKYFRLRK